MPATQPKLLLLLPQLPQDPASGAPRSLTSISELLAERGWQVRALATTASESSLPLDPVSLLEQRGITVERVKRRGGELRYIHRGISFRVLTISPGLTLKTWEGVHGRAFDRAFGEELSAFRPDILFTYGMRHADVRRQQLAIRAGARVVFGLRNEAYLGFRGWGHVSGVLTPSRYMSDLYRDDAALACTDLPVPLDPEEIVASEHDPIFITMVNPSVRKGVDFFVRLADRVSRDRPDLPFLVVESGATAGNLMAAGERAGIDLRRHENIMVSPSVPQPRDIFRPTRLLLVPSLREPGARVVAEALLNGVPPLVSDRGGLPEMCHGAGLVLPIEGDDSVRRWAEAIVTLMDDEERYRRERDKARRAAAFYERAPLGVAYDTFFRRVLDARPGAPLAPSTPLTPAPEHEGRDRD